MLARAVCVSPDCLVYNPADVVYCQECGEKLFQSIYTECETQKNPQECVNRTIIILMVLLVFSIVLMVFINFRQNTITPEPIKQDWYQDFPTYYMIA